MEELFVQFRLDSIKVLQSRVKWNDGIGFGIEELRHEFLERAFLKDKEVREKSFRLLTELQFSTGNDTNSLLKRFKLESEILIVAIKNKQELEKELTAIANRYIKDFRIQTIGAVIAAGDTSEETKVSEFYLKLIEIQKKLLFENSVGL